MNFKPLRVESPKGWIATIRPFPDLKPEEIPMGKMEFRFGGHVEEMHCQMHPLGYFQVYLHGTKHDWDDADYGRYVRAVYAAANELAALMNTEPCVEIYLG